MSEFEDLFFEIVCDNQALLSDHMAQFVSATSSVIKIEIDDKLVKIDVDERRVIGSSPHAQSFNQWSQVNQNSSWRKLFTQLLKIYCSPQQSNSQQSEASTAVVVQPQSNEEQELKFPNQSASVVPPSLVKVNSRFSQRSGEEEDYDEWENFKEEEVIKGSQTILNTIGMKQSIVNNIQLGAEIIQAFKQSPCFQDAEKGVKLLESNYFAKNMKDYFKLVNIPESMEFKILLNSSAFMLNDEAKKYLRLNGLNPIIVSIQINPGSVFGGPEQYRKIQLEDVIINAEYKIEISEYTVGEIIKDDFLKSLVLKYISKISEKLLNLPLSQAKRARKAKNYFLNTAIKLKSQKNKKTHIEDQKQKESKLGIKDIVKKLIEMGFNHDSAHYVVEQTDLDLEEAINALTDSQFIIPKEYIKKKKEESKIMKKETKSKQQLIQPQVDSFFYALGVLLSWRLMNFNDYCVICHSPMVSGSFKPLPCEDELCQFRFQEVLGESLASHIRNHFERFRFEISLAMNAIFSHRNGSVFEPFPPYFLRDREIRSKAGYFDKIKDGKQKSKDSSSQSNKMFKELKHLLTLLPRFDQLLQYSETQKDLRQFLIDHYTKSIQNLQSSRQLDSYKILQFVMQNNPIIIQKLQGTKMLQKIAQDKTEQYILFSPPSQKQREFQEAKKKNGSIFIWHGSSTQNWYSIIRNGLRVLSHTKLMTAGAALGTGIYTATQMQTSLGYSRYHNGDELPINCSTRSKQIIGIVEIINLKEYQSSKNYMGSGVYVITKDNHIRLRYLLVTDGSEQLDLKNCEKHYYSYLQSERSRILNNRQSEAKKHEKLFYQCIKREGQRQDNLKEQLEKNRQEKLWEQDKSLQDLQKKIIGKGSTRASQRILSEYKLFTTSKDFSNYKIEFGNKDSVYVWILKLDIINMKDIPKDLVDDFKLYAKQSNSKGELTFEITFPQNYPYSPPFMRVIRPRFQFHSGHITIGGSICTQALTPSGWNITRTIQSLFVEILTIISEGGGRLDKSQMMVDYTVGEARQAFKRVGERYGWL